MNTSTLDAARELVQQIQEKIISKKQITSTSADGGLASYGQQTSPRQATTLTQDEINGLIVKIETLKTSLLGSSNLERAPRSESTSKVSLSTFFSNVGSSVIEAQDLLDKEISAKRIHDHLDPLTGTIPRAMYRIPKVSAEVNLGFDLSDSKKVNMFVFGKEHSEKESMQQKVSFEIVSVPAPIELIDETAERRVILDRLALGTDSDDKKTIRDGLGAAFVRRGPESWLVALGTAAPPPSVILALIPYASTQEVTCKRIASDSEELIGVWLMPLASSRQERSGS